MSGGYFDNSEWTIRNLAEEMGGFVHKQWMYRMKEVNENLPTGDWDHELSPLTLNRIQVVVDTLEKSASMFKLVDYLLSGDTSEETFNNQWQENNFPNS